MRRKVFLAVVSAVVFGASVFSSPLCEASITGRAKPTVERIVVHDPVPVKILADYRKEGFSGVIDLGTYTNIDDAKMIAYANFLLDGKANLAKQACTCVVKPLMINGRKVPVMGRNMDLPSSNYPAYVYRIKQPGKYQTINIGYANDNLEGFDQIAETSTIDKEMYARCCYSLTDVMNEKGLMIETNMRGRYAAIAATGTNPGKLRICETILPRYAADHCATIAEVLEALKDLDVYTANSDLYNWHSAFVMADATGRYGVLEFVGNKPVWHEGYPGQANFWVDKQARKVAKVDGGYGRWARVMQQYHGIKTQLDMQKVMASVHYGRFYYEDAKDVGYDIASEMTEVDLAQELDIIQGWIEKYKIKVPASELDFLQKLATEQQTKQLRWDSEWTTDPDNFATIYRVADIISSCMRQLPSSARNLSNRREISSISYVANTVEKVYHVRFFETGKTFDFGFDGITRDEE